MGLAESALAQHRADLAALIEECPASLRIGTSVLSVSLDMPASSFEVVQEGVQASVSLTAIGLAKDLSAPLLARDLVEVRLFGADEYAQYAVVSFQTDAVSFIARLQTYDSRERGLGFT